MKKMAKRISDCLSVLIIIILLLIIGWTFLNKGRPPSIFGYKFYDVLSESMEPKISKGSLILIKDIDSDELKEGDIITFNLYDSVASKENPEGATTITHRIYKIEESDGEKIYTTKGDHNNTPDSKKIKASQICGKVIYHVPLIGVIVDFIKQNIILIVIAFIAVEFILKVIEKKNNKLK